MRGRCPDRVWFSCVDSALSSTSQAPPRRTQQRNHQHLDNHHCHHNYLKNPHYSLHRGPVAFSEIFRKCEGIDIVQADHAPQAGVAQGIFHGDLIRHQGGHQEELEEELKEEVERRVRRHHSSNQTQVRMRG